MIGILGIMSVSCVSLWDLENAGSLSPPTVKQKEFSMLQLRREEKWGSL